MVKSVHRGRGALLSLVLALVAMLWVGPAEAAIQAYYYDAAGRLTGVVDGANGTAVYTLDGAGNVLSVTEKPITTLIVGGFVPATGPAGTSVTIGGNFAAATTSNTTVKFNNTAATVTAVSATKITVTVPSGATTGPISVTVSASSGGGSYTTGLNFTVPGAAQAPPTITAVSSGSSTSLPFLLASQVVRAAVTTGSTPTPAEYGYVVNITGTNFDTTNTQVFLNNNAGLITSITTTSITAQFALNVTTGHIMVETPSGSATTSGYIFAAPIISQYSDNASSSPPFQAGALYPNSAIVSMQSMTIGQTVNVKTLGMGQVALIALDVSAGQSINFQLSASVSECCTDFLIYDPSGLVDGGTEAGSVAAYPTVAKSGTVLLAVESQTSSTSTVTSFLSPPPLQASLPTNGTLTSVTSTTPGQIIDLTFSGTKGSRVTLGTPALPNTTTPLAVAVNVIAPDGITSVYKDNTALSADLFGIFQSDAFSLPQTGQYTVVLSNAGAASTIGSFQIAAWQFNDIIGSTAYNSTNMPVTMTFTAPGQNAYYTFQGTQGDVLTLATDMTGKESLKCYWAGLILPNPDGTASAQYGLSRNNELLPIDGCGSSPMLLQILPLTGTYTVVINQSPANSIQQYNQFAPFPSYSPVTSDFGVYKIIGHTRCADTVSPQPTPCLVQTGTSAKPVPTTFDVDGVGEAVYATFTPTQNGNATVSVSVSPTLDCFAVMTGQPNTSQTSWNSTGQICNGTATVPSFGVSAGTSYVVYIQPLFPGSPAGMSGFGTGTATLSVVVQ